MHYKLVEISINTVLIVILFQMNYSMIILTVRIKNLEILFKIWCKAKALGRKKYVYKLKIRKKRVNLNSTHIF